MKTIKLTKGLEVMVDDDRYDELIKYKWHVLKGTKTFYAISTVWNKIDKKYNHILMHRFLLNLSKRNDLCDHIDGNGLNNCLSNLRKCTSSENNSNRNKSYGTSKYKGVYLFQGKFHCGIMKNKKTHYLGSFSNEIEAAKAYNKKSIELHGEFAKLNII